MTSPNASGKTYKRLVEHDRGYSLIELMIVISIIAILMLIGLSYYIGARQRSQDRAAQAELGMAAKVETGVYADTREFSDDTNRLRTEAATQNYTLAASTAPNEVSVHLPGGEANQIVVLGARSNTGTCFYLRRSATGETALGSREGVPCDPDASGVITWSPEW